MRFRDKGGDDRFVGGEEDDIFVIFAGNDRVDGRGGFDRLTVDYSGDPRFSLAFCTVDIGSAGSISGQLVDAASRSITFRGIKHLVFRASDNDTMLLVGVNGDGAGSWIDADAGVGNDTLNITWQGASPATVSSRRDSTLLTGSGEFAGFEFIELVLGSGTDHVETGRSTEKLYGRGGDDVLSGGSGEDWLFGGQGSDMLYGGKGADLFRYSSIRDTGPDAPDHIMDFSHAQRDRIFLSDLDADASIRGNQAFTFIGEREFADQATFGGELRQQANGDGTLTIEGDVDGDDIADFSIIVHTPTLLVAADFGL